MTKCFIEYLGGPRDGDVVEAILPIASLGVQYLQESLEFRVPVYPENVTTVLITAKYSPEETPDATS